MGKVWSAARTKVGLVAIGLALLATGVGVGAGVATGSIGTAPAGETSAVTSEPVPPTSSSPAASTAAASTPEPPTAPIASAAPVATQTAPPPAAAPRPATVTRVTTPATAPDVQDSDGIGTTGPDGAYTPAPPVQHPGEPPVVGGPPPLPPAPLLPGEPGYKEPTPAG